MKAWTFARSRYAKADVRVTALALQDRHGQCVSLLLWRLWAAAEGRRVDDPLLERAVTAARLLEARVLGPSRRARTFLRDASSPFAKDSRDRARLKVGAGEIATERMLIETLEAMTPAGRGAREEGDLALERLAIAWGRSAPRRLLTALNVASS